MNKSSNGYDCVANGTNGSTVIQNGSARKIGPPNYGATVIDSRAVDYLLMKLRSKDTESKVKVYSELIQKPKEQPLHDVFNIPIAYNFPIDRSSWFMGTA